MYTEKYLHDHFASNYVSMIDRMKLLYFLNEKSKSSRDMTDLLIYLIHEHYQMMNQHVDLMTNNDFFFIRSVEQIEYKTRLSKHEQEQARVNLKELHLIEFDNKSICRSTRYKVNIEEIVKLFNDNELKFREIEQKHQIIEEKSKQYRAKYIQKKKDKQEVFNQINKLKYKSYDEIESYMLKHEFTVSDAQIVCIVSKLYLKYKHKEYVFSEVDLNTIRKRTCNLSREEENKLFQNYEELKSKIYYKFDDYGLVSACKSEKKSSLVRDVYEALTLIDRFESSYSYQKYDFSKDEDYEYLKNEVSENLIYHYLNDF